MREKTGCRLYSPNSIFHFPEVHWSLPIKTATVGFCSIWRAIGQAFIYWSKTRVHDSQQTGTKTDRRPNHKFMYYSHMIFDKDAKNSHWRKESIFNKWYWKKNTVFHVEEWNQNWIHHSCTKFNSQYIKGLTMKTEMQKLLAKYNVLQTSQDRLPFVPELKPVPDKWDLKKQASFHTARETISQVEKFHTVRENICQLPQTED